MALAQLLYAFSFLCLGYILTNTAEAELLAQSALVTPRVRRMGWISICVYERRLGHLQPELYFAFAVVVMLELTFGIVTLWLIYTVFTRLYTSPLAKFPGPRLAALTTWYQFYFDVIKDGHLPWYLAHLHQIYGEYPVHSLITSQHQC